MKELLKLIIMAIAITLMATSKAGAQNLEVDSAKGSTQIISQHQLDSIVRAQQATRMPVRIYVQTSTSAQPSACQQCSYEGQATVTSSENIELERLRMARRLKDEEKMRRSLNQANPRQKVPSPRVNPNLPYGYVNPL